MDQHSSDGQFDLQPTPFIRGSNIRKSVRIKRQRFHNKVPPSALIYMKSLELTSKAHINDTVVRRSHSKFHIPAPKIDHKIDLEVSIISEDSEITIECDDEDVKLIPKQPVLRFRNSFKKFQKKRKLLDFFKKSNY